MDWAAGLLGAAKGGGEAVGQIAEDERRALAEKLKLEAMHALDMEKQKDQQQFVAGQQADLFKHQAAQDKLREAGLNQRQIELIKSNERTSKAERESRENIHKMDRENQFQIHAMDRASSERIHSMDRASAEKTAGMKAGGKDGELVIKGLNGLRSTMQDLVSKYKWNPGKEVPATYLELMNSYATLAGLPTMTQKQIKKDGLAGWWGATEYQLTVDGGSSAPTPGSLVSPQVTAAAGGAPPASGEASPPPPQPFSPWRDTPTGRSIAQGSAASQATQPISPAGVSASTPSSPAASPAIPRGSFTQGPTEADRQAAIAEVTDLARRVGNDYAKVWGVMSDVAKQAWGSYEQFAAWFNRNTFGRAMDSQKRAYRDTFQR